MDLINFIFRLGVLFAIFGFIWWLINALVNLLRNGLPKSVAETYIVKFVRYFFMVDVTILFCLDADEGYLDLSKCIMAGLILILYFLGRLQNAQMKQRFVSIQTNLFPSRNKQIFSQKAEVIVISLASILFAVLLFFPEYAKNPISSWFYETIIDFEEAPLLGFIFKIVGFFFVISIFMKLFRGLSTLLSGGQVNQPNTFQDSNSDSEDDDDKFDDYEEVN